jgi:predicted nucleic acid-binding protein
MDILRQFYDLIHIPASELPEYERHGARQEIRALEVAQRRGIPIVGFPGILIRACRQGLIGPEEVRDALRECQRQETHYSNRFIEEIYNRLRRS